MDTFAHRSLHLYHATRKTNDAGPDRIVDTFVPFNGLPDLLYEKERCDRNHHGIRWTTTVPVQEALSALLDGLTGEPVENERVVFAGKTQQPRGPGPPKSHTSQGTIRPRAVRGRIVIGARDQKIRRQTGRNRRKSGEF